MTVSNGKLSNVQEVPLAELSKTATSNSIERVNGISKPVTKDGQAELSLSHAVASDGENIVATTITNTGTSKFYLMGFLLKGGTVIDGGKATGIQNLDAYIVDIGYSPEVWGKIPKPPVTDAVVLNPGESYSAYIKGNWIIDVTNQPIKRFSVGATYMYDINAAGYQQGNNWGIDISDYPLP